jgi:hypothetical protein
MSEPYFDGEEFTRWLSTHPPTSTKKPSLLVDQEGSDDISFHYSVVLHIPRPFETLEVPLEEKIELSNLFSHAFAPFTMLELAQWADANELDEKYRARVEEEFKLFRWQLGWETSALGTKHVTRREHLDRLRCYLRAMGTIPPVSAKVGYTTAPYISVTATGLELRVFLDTEALDQAWQGCWKTGIAFRSFL